MEYYNELYHHGIKGMKWGVRRYQRKDGSLTPAGQKRRAKLENELEKLGGGQKKTDGDDTPKKKSISEMSNKELQEHTARMQLEKQYYDAQKQLAIANPPKVSAGQKFANKMLNDVIMPAATNAGKQYLEKMLKEKAGIKDDVKVNWDDMIKKQTFEKNERDKAYQDLKRNNDINQEKDRAEARDRKRAEENAKSSDKSDNASGNTNKQKQSSNSRKTEKSKVYEGTVEGTSTSKKSNSEPKWSSKKETVIDAEFTEMGVDDVPASTTNRGQSYITALLEAPKERDN